MPLFEKRWAPVPVQLLISNGTTDGQLQIADAFLLRVKQIILLKSTTQDTRILEVKRVISKTTFYVGLIGDNIDARSDVSAFLVADGASISTPDAFQPRSKISQEDYARAVYDEEPVIAIRTVTVDRGGRYIGSDPDLPFYVYNVASESGSVGKNPTIDNIDMPDADTEYSIAIPVGTKGFRAKLRNIGAGPAKLKVAFIMGESGTNYVSMAPGSWYIPPASLSTEAGLTMYFQATKDDQILEFETWV